MFRMEGRNTGANDRLSSLPFGIIDNILGRMPIKDAVRTCVLSKKWRYNWTKLSKLVFDDSCGTGSRFLWFEWDRFVNFVYHFLLSHSCKIDTFTIKTSLDLQYCNLDIDNWLYFVMGDNIKEITLWRYTRYKYQIPSSLFSCEQLTHLEMNEVLLQVPSEFNGFRNLVCLKLHSFATDSPFGYVYGEVLERLINNCPVLERLELAIFRMLVPVVIQAPKLKYLYLHGDFRGIILQNCPLLEDVTLKEYGISNVFADPQEQHMTCDLLKNLCLLSGLKSLKVSLKILSNLHFCDMSESLLTASDHFNVLEITSVSLGKIYEVMTSLTLLKTFSNLKKLSITLRWDIFAREQIDILSILNQSSCYMRDLKSVKIRIELVHDVPNLELHWYLEDEYMKFILARSPFLEDMTIECDQRLFIHETMFLRKLLSLKRSWRHVKISFNLFRPS